MLKNNTLSKTSSINVDNQSIINPLLIVEHYHDYFSNIGPKLANQIPQCDINFQDYLRNPNSHSILFAPVTEQELISIVFNLPNKNSSGYDTINNLVISEIISAIYKPLSFIMNQSLCSGIVENSQSNSSL